MEGEKHLEQQLNYQLNLKEINKLIRKSKCDNIKDILNYIQSTDNEFTNETPWYWFFAYFNQCVMKDICKDLPLTHVHRLLVNAQNPGHTSQTHTDFNRPATSIIYHAYGEDGDTTFANGERVAFKRGRIIVFSSLLEHDGEPPTKDIRISLGAICPHKGVHIS